MKRLILVVLLFFCLGITAGAQESSGILESSGALELYAGDELEENGVSFSDPSGILKLTPQKIWELLKNAVRDKINEPLRLFMLLLAVTVLTAVIESASDTVRSKELSRLFGLICVLVCMTVLTKPVCECLRLVGTSLSEGSNFMLGFVPVLSGITAAGGNVTAASGYSFLVLGFADIAVKLSEKIFVPLLSMCIGLAAVSGCCEAISLGGLLNAVKKAVTWGLGLIMTVFTGLLSIQSIVGSSADSVSLRTAKYVLSNSVPVVGAAASEAYTTVKSSVSLLKNGIGGTGIAALCIMLLPPVIEVILYRMTFGALGAVSEIFGSKKLAELFKNINAVLAAAFGIIVSFSLMFIVSTGIVMALCGGGQ